MNDAIRTTVASLLLLTASTTVLWAEGSGDDAGAVFDFFAEEAKVRTATKTEVSQAEVPATVFVITAREIQQHGYRTLGEALRMVPGLYVTDDKNYQYLGARGINIPGDYASRVLLLVDGHTTNEPIYGSAFVGQEQGVDLGSLERIEVVLGPGSSVYGTHAMLAVVNMITRKGADTKGGRLQAAWGSLREAEGSASAGYALGKDLGLYASVGGLKRLGLAYHAAEYEYLGNGGTLVEHDGEQAERAQLRLDWKGLTLEGGWNNRWKSLPTASYGSIVDEPASNTTDRADWLELAWNQALAEGWDLRLRAFHRDYSYKGVFYYWLPDELDPLRYVEEHFSIGDSSSVGAEAQLTWTRAANTLTAGFEFKDHYRLHLMEYDGGYSDPALRAVQLDSDSSLQYGSAYAQDIYKLGGGFSAVLGARFDDYSTFGASFNPRVGLVFASEGGHSAKLLYGRAFNAPLLYFTGWADGTTGVGNPGLKPETLECFELTGDVKLSPRVKAGASLYQNQLDQQIRVGTDPVSGLKQFQNLGRARARGLELRLQGELDGLQLRAGASFVDNRDLETDQEIPGSLRESASVSASRAFADGLWHLALDAEMVGHRVDAAQVPVPGYARVNAAWGLHPGGGLDLTVRVSNAFDNAIEQPNQSGGILRTVRQDGRSYWVQTGWSF